MRGRPLDFQEIAWILNICAMILALTRVFLTGLWRSYPRLTIYLAIDALNTFLPFVIPIASNAYGYSYMALRAANLLVAIGVVLELYRLALARYPALAAFGRKVARYVLVCAAAIAFLAVALDLKVLRRQSVLLHRFFTAERSLDLIVLVFLVFISVFLLWFPVKIRRNIVLYLAGFFVYFLARVLALLTANLLPARQIGVVSATLMLIASVCLIGWAIGLRREEEQTATVTGHRWNPAAMQGLAEQLDAINAAAGRMSRF